MALLLHFFMKGQKSSPIYSPKTITSNLFSLVPKLCWCLCTLVSSLCHLLDLLYCENTESGIVIQCFHCSQGNIIDIDWRTK